MQLVLRHLKINCPLLDIKRIISMEQNKADNQVHRKRFRQVEEIGR
jgi:hypothetical protein